jgi:biopolymer transport protein ExbD
MPLAGPPRSRESIPNLAPMVDVVMVILIFFMLGTSFALREGELRTRLPSDVGPGQGATVTPIPAVRIDLDTPDAGRSASIVVMGTQQVESFDALTAMMRDKIRAGADPTGRITLSAAPQVRYKYVIAAFDACARAGFTNIQFAVRAAAES